MYNDKQSVSIEERLTSALRDMENKSTVNEMPDVAPVQAVDLGDYSSQELLQLAYDQVETEINALQSELRELRARHKNEEEAIERRLIQKNALRNKIISEAAPR